MPRFQVEVVSDTAVAHVVAYSSQLLPEQAHDLERPSMKSQAEAANPFDAATMAESG